MGFVEETFILFLRYSAVPHIVLVMIGLKIKPSFFVVCPCPRYTGTLGVTVLSLDWFKVVVVNYSVPPLFGSRHLIEKNPAIC